MRRPSPALVVACIALLVALTGTSYATVLNVPRNSVGTLQLKRNAVKPAKLAPNAVRTAHVLNGSLLAVDFKAGQLPQGPKGDQGDKGDKGAKGDPGATNVTARSASLVAPAGGIAQTTVSCQASEVATGGGIRLSGGNVTNLRIVSSAPNATVGTPTGWAARIENGGAGQIQTIVTVVCARP